MLDSEPGNGWLHLGDIPDPGGILTVDPSQEVKGCFHCKLKYVGKLATWQRSEPSECFLC